MWGVPVESDGYASLRNAHELEEKPWAPPVATWPHGGHSLTVEPYKIWSTFYAFFEGSNGCVCGIDPPCLEHKANLLTKEFLQQQTTKIEQPRGKKKYLTREGIGSFIRWNDGSSTAV